MAAIICPAPTLRIWQFSFGCGVMPKTHVPIGHRYNNTKMKKAKEAQAGQAPLSPPRQTEAELQPLVDRASMK